VFFLTVLLCSVAHATIYYVKSDGNDSSNGLSWSTAFATLQKALDVYTSGDQIWVAKGTYVPTSTYGLGDDERLKHFRLKNNVKIYGGFTGIETSVNERRNFGVGQENETILSGDIGEKGWSFDNCYHVFYHPVNLGLDSTAVLDGFTIKGGQADGDNMHNFGGGMYNSPSSSKIVSCTFTNNSAFYCGGGMYNSSSYLISTSCTFTNNIAQTGYGGGCIYNEQSFLTINNSIIWGNIACEGNGNQLYICGGGITTLNYSCYANGINDVHISNGTFTATNHDITSDPMFIGSGEHPYLIYGNSPCVDAGNNDYVTEQYDIRGSGYPRKLDKTTGKAGTIDMGTY